MNNKKYLFSSISSVTLVNIFSMLITAFLTLILPRYVLKVDYSIWQLFVFYQGYLGFFHFGWNDGVYIRYGGKKYSELNKSSFFAQFWLQMLLELAIAVCICIFAVLIDGSNEFVWLQIAINIIILNSRYMLIYILQTTARIKDYSSVLFVDRFFYIAIILVAFIVKRLDYRTLIYAETVSKFFAYLLAIYYCKDIVFRKINEWKVDFKEIWENISVGIKIMFSNIASILLIGIIRFGIEQNWGLEIFGEISLTITLSQLFITFITNIGMVIFPLLKRMDINKMKHAYQVLNVCLSVVLLCGMSTFYPGRLILEKWLPEYRGAIGYMGLLLPICYYESKMGLLNNTYMKALRAEKKIMLINCSTMSLAIIFSAICSFGLNNLTLSVFSILFLIALRCIWFEKSVRNILKSGKNALYNAENICVLAFIIFNYCVSGIIGFIGYGIIAIMYLIYRLKELKQSIRLIR